MRESDILLRIAFHIKAGDARQNITFASLAVPIALYVFGANRVGSATFPFSFMLDRNANAMSNSGIFIIRNNCEYQDELANKLIDIIKPDFVFGAPDVDMALMYFKFNERKNEGVPKLILIHYLDKGVEDFVKFIGGSKSLKNSIVLWYGKGVSLNKIHKGIKINHVFDGEIDDKNIVNNIASILKLKFDLTSR